MNSFGDGNFFKQTNSAFIIVYSFCGNTKYKIQKKSEGTQSCFSKLSL